MNDRMSGRSKALSTHYAGNLCGGMRAPLSRNAMLYWKQGRLTKMADDFTLMTFTASWKTYQDHLAAAVAQLSAEQLGLRAAPRLRSVGENALHIVGCRMFWFTEALGEDGGEELKPYV